MKGLSLEVVIALILAVIGVTMFIALVTGNLAGATNFIYCNTYVRITNLIPSVEGPNTPEICSFEGTVRTENLPDTDKKIFSRKLLAYIINCWNNVEQMKVEKDYSCYELKLSGQVDNVTEQDLSDILIKEDHCKSIENADYGCGAKDQILWDIDSGIITDQKVLLVKYNYDNDIILVKG